MTNRICTLILTAATIATGGERAYAIQGQSAATPNCPTEQIASTKKDATGQAAGTKDKASDPCVQTQKEPSTSERFPFPGEAPPPMPGSVPPAVPDAPRPKQPSAADKYPFPGSAPPMPDSESSSSSSSSSSNSSADDPRPAASSNEPPLDDKGDNPKAITRRRLPKVTKLQSDEERADEDLTVAKYYEAAGDLNAAYLRARDAVKYQPSDPDAHFILGHLAQRLNKRDEAIAEFNSYIRLEPDGDKIKKAQKALAQLQRP